MSIICGIIASVLCGIIGLMCGVSGTIALFERKIKSGYIQIDHEIYQARIVLRGKPFKGDE